ncbi:hypothetical protein CNY89_19900 [Amaricoccus sp. HAR-UPW-R2A-40]|nr:hypothetical protein CNY89_19900 [Amaricoccus sp. HAR-UPW-R2A-40]
MSLIFIIRNDWDDRYLCGLDLAWINDGRATSKFKTEGEAAEAYDRYLIDHPEDEGRITIELYP